MRGSANTLNNLPRRWLLPLQHVWGTCHWRQVSTDTALTKELVQFLNSVDTRVFFLVSSETKLPTYVISALLNRLCVCLSVCLPGKAVLNSHHQVPEKFFGDPDFYPWIMIVILLPKIHAFDISYSRLFTRHRLGKSLCVYPSSLGRRAAPRGVTQPQHHWTSFTAGTASHPLLQKQDWTVYQCPYAGIIDP